MLEAASAWGEGSVGSLAVPHCTSPALHAHPQHGCLRFLHGCPCSCRLLRITAQCCIQLRI